MRKNYKLCCGKLLVIEDNPSLRDLLAKWLKTRGYYYEFVKNEKEAGNHLRYSDFDVVMRGGEFIFNQELKRKIPNKFSKTPSNYPEK